MPLAIVGGPLPAGHYELFDAVERFGGRIVLNATEGGELTLPAALDRPRVSDDPLAALVGAYFGAIPHAMRRPNDGLYDWLRRELAGRGVRGILFNRCLWCDLWHGELGRLREWAGVPVLDMDVADEDVDFGRQAGRVKAFLEMFS